MTTTPSADPATAREHRGSHSLAADAESGGDLGESQTVCVEPGSVLADRVGQLGLACRHSGLPGYLAHRAAVHLEPRSQLSHRHAGSVPGEQFSPIGEGLPHEQVTV